MRTPRRDWSVYILRCDGRWLYTGVTSDVARRMAEHAAGHPRGARFTRRFSRFELVYKARVGSRGKAQRVEAGIKSLSRSRKEALLKSYPSGEELIALLGIAPEDEEPSPRGPSG